MALHRRQFLELLTLAAVTSCARSTSTPSLATDVTGESMRAHSPASQERTLAMRTRPLFDLRLSAAPTQDIGATPSGPRVIFPITGGSFEGERIRGKVLPSGDDWTLRRADGVMELDLRVTLATDDGALIHLTFEGIRNDDAPGAPYFRTLLRFETASPRYEFLNRMLAVGSGEIEAQGPVHRIEEIL